MIKTLLTTLLFAGFLAVPVYGQNPLDKTYTFECLSCTPSEALVKLSKQIGKNIGFNEHFFEDCPKSDFSYKKMPLDKLISKLSACGDRIGYKVNDGEIALYRKTTKYTISGFVTDQQSVERLIGVTLRFIHDGQVSGVKSNEFGFYSIALEPGMYTVYVHYIGYAMDSITLDVEKSKRIDFSLANSSTNLKEVEVTPLNTDERASERQTNQLQKYLKTIPMPGGEADIMRFTAMQPGVQAGVDGIGGLHVRGGNADQNLILLDDVPVYNPNHALGIFSIFNSNTISNAKFYKGDFPARYGGRASSVLDIRTRDGNLKEYEAQVSAGLLAASAVVEGPIKKDKSSFLIGYRNSYFRPWIDLINNQPDIVSFNTKDLQYEFFDANIKLNYIYSPRNRFYLSFYKGGDRFFDNFQQKSQTTEGVFNDHYGLRSNWGNWISALRWNHLLRNNLFMNTTVRYSRFEYQNQLGRTTDFIANSGRENRLADYGQLYQTIIGDWSAKSDFTFYASNNITLRFGGASTWHQFQPGALSVNFQLPGQLQTSIDSLASILRNNEKLSALEVEGYVDADYTIKKFWHITGGFNGSVFQIGQTNYPMLLPRIKLERNGPKKWSYWAGFSSMAQNLHQIGTYNIGLPFELWVPSTPKIAPVRVTQSTLGLGWQKKDWTFKVEGYYKNLNRIWVLQSSTDALIAGGAEDASGWEDRLAEGHGYSKGVEVSVEKKEGFTTGSIVYTLSNTTRQFDDVNQGAVFPFRFDRRHDLKVMIQQRFTKQLNANLVWSFATGNPITLASVRYTNKSPDSGAPARDVYAYTSVNGYRLRANHRLDASLNFHFGTRGNRQQCFQLGVYNAYNRSNQLYVLIDGNTNKPGKATQYSIFPVLPILRYELKL